MSFVYIRVPRTTKPWTVILSYISMNIFSISCVRDAVSPTQYNTNYAHSQFNTPMKAKVYYPRDTINYKPTMYSSRGDSPQPTLRRTIRKQRQTTDNREKTLHIPISFPTAQPLNSQGETSHFLLLSAEKIGE